MIDGGAERLEQEFISYLLSRQCTTPAELAQHFHLSERTAAYWLSCLVKSGRVRIVRIEGQTVDHAADAHADGEALPEREGRCWPQAVLEVCQESEAA